MDQGHFRFAQTGVVLGYKIVNPYVLYRPYFQFFVLFPEPLFNARLQPPFSLFKNLIYTVVL